MLQGVRSGRVESGKIFALGVTGRKADASPAARWIESPPKDDETAWERVRRRKQKSEDSRQAAEAVRNGGKTQFLVPHNLQAPGPPHR